MICNIAICDDDTTHSSACDQASDLLHTIELASKLEFDLQEILDWRRSWLVDFNAGKTILLSCFI